jgi:hypothetical protein
LERKLHVFYLRVFLDLAAWAGAHRRKPTYTSAHPRILARDDKMKKLDKKNIEEILPLTPMQEGMLFHYLKEPESNQYFEQLSLEISGDIDNEIFEKAWNFVIETNEMLRAVFRWERVEQPMQVILKEHKLLPRYCACTSQGGDPGEKKKWLERIKEKDRTERFDLRSIPFRVTLCEIEKRRYEIIISNHHILYDGWSMGIILKEFFAAYHILANGKEPVIPCKTKFKEFVKWNRRQDYKNKQETFWRNFLKGFDRPTELSIKRKITGRATAAAGKNQVRFEKDVKARLEDFVKRRKITLASFLYSAWGLLLQKYNNSDDMIFGTTVSGRTTKLKGINDTVGLFINTIPLRIHTRHGDKIEDLLHNIDKILKTREEVNWSLEKNSLISL